MPFSSLADPIDLARTHAALETAWREIKRSDFHLLGSDEVERRRLAVIIAGLAPICRDDAALADRAVRMFKK